MTTKPNYFELYYRYFGAKKSSGMLEPSELSRLKKEKIEKGILAGTVPFNPGWYVKPVVRQVGDNVVFLYADKYLAPLELNLHVGFVAEENKELYYQYRQLFETLIKRELAVKL